MTPAEVKQILLACRVDTDDVRDADVAAALEEVRRVPELLEWWQTQQQFQAVMRGNFRQIEPPTDLRDKILARVKVIRVAWWRRPATLAAAAAIALLLAVAAALLRPPPQDTFAVFRSRMVGYVLRQYAMSITTNNVSQVRQHLASRNAPADYELPPKLDNLPLVGAGVLSWHDQQVSMVCIDSKSKGMLFLFVVSASSLKQSPATLDFAAVRSLNTVSWTAGGKTYVLAGNLNAEELKALL
jgi:hypothetical protein